ncbi:MAG TPA: hypothetical protein VGD65_17010 [Chryseosolibacter sp.]
MTAAWNDAYIQHAVQLNYGKPYDQPPPGVHEFFWCSQAAVVSKSRSIQWLTKVTSAKQTICFPSTWFWGLQLCSLSQHTAERMPNYSPEVAKK